MPRHTDPDKEKAICRLRVVSVILSLVSIVSMIALVGVSITEVTMTHTTTPFGYTLLGGNISQYKKPCHDIDGIKSHLPIAYRLNNDTSGVLSCPWAGSRSAVRISVGIAGIAVAIAAFIVCHIKHTRWAYLTSALLMAAALAVGYAGTRDISSYSKASSFCSKGMPDVKFNINPHVVKCKMEVFMGSILLDVVSCVILLGTGCETVVFICKAGKAFYDPEKKHISSDDIQRSDDEASSDDTSADKKEKSSGFSFFGKKKTYKVEEGDTDFEQQTDSHSLLSEKEREEAEGDSVDFEKESKKRFSPFSAKKEQKRSTARSLFGSKEPAPETEAPSSSTASAAPAGNDLFNFDEAPVEKKEAPKPEPVVAAPKVEPKVEPKPAASSGGNGDFFDFESIPESKQ